MLALGITFYPVQMGDQPVKQDVQLSDFAVIESLHCLAIALSENGPNWRDTILCALG